MIGWGGGGGDEEEEVMELLWQDGQVVVKGQRSPRKPHDHPLDLIPSVAAAVCRGFPSPVGDPLLQHHHQQQQEDANNNNHLFIQEDEMSSWLFSDICSDLLLPSVPAATSSVPSHPPAALPRPKRLDSFGQFSRPNRPRAAAPADEATTVDSSDTPMAARVSEDAARVGAQFVSPAVGVVSSRDWAATSCSSVSADPIPSAKTEDIVFSPKATADDAPEERKRKARDSDWSNDGEDVEPSLNDGKRVLRGSSSAKRSRAAEVHNLSERRRRDRITRRLRALQELIPHCNKADKASILDKAIGYLKFLQMQVQIMSMGCGMTQMMFPGMQQYTPHMGMGMNRPMIPFPNVFNSSTLSTTAAGPHMGPGFRFPAFQMPPHISAPDPSRMPPNIQSNTTLSSSSLQNSYSPRMPGFMYPYQNFFGLPHMHFHFQQTQANTSSSGKPTTRKAGEASQKESPD
ncbi:hypothetical protein MLD38_021693 [Melastoma candidum]|uniref:Uncharacterized protein n=1 Tax=Melastoma candidum TaxID=119954 RepID=A0ACB9QGQ1_9MYRT|nr:hypothetical protein MLD38_021693 [Melastoma candidum]